jgi:Uma2 family endonuclease
MSTTKQWTIAEAAQLPDNGRLFEIIKGDLIEMAPPGGEHAELLAEATILIGSFVRRTSLGSIFSGDGGFILARDPDILLGPDVAFVQSDRLPPREERTGWLELAPDLAVEIVSPNDSFRDVERKVALYLDHGVRQVWVLNPRERTLSKFTPGPALRRYRDDEVVEGDDVLPGFAEPVAAFFR